MPNPKGLFDRWFPLHRGHRRFRAWHWASPYEVYLNDAHDLADLERRMRIWLVNGWW